MWLSVINETLFHKSKYIISKFASQIKLWAQLVGEKKGITQGNGPKFLLQFGAL